MGTVERLVRYAKIDTQAAYGTGTRPSSAKQFDLARMLCDEMKELGIRHARMDDMAYVYGEIPATPSCEDAPAIGFIAHIDTAPDFTGTNANPRVIENYDGGDIELGAGRVLQVEKFPHLRDLKGDTLVVTDGTTLLGADDKAGVAVIMTAMEQLLQSDMPHGKVCVCFNPDEEIGEGAWDLSPEELGADYAYTIDGGAAGDLIYECFNGSCAYITIHGFNVHPGTAKNKMINAGLIATQLVSQLPLDETPATTEGYEGFFHLSRLSGNTEKAELRIIIRDHDREKFLAREAKMRAIIDGLNEQYGPGTVELDLQQQYSNMADEIRKHMHMIDIAADAIRSVGIEPKIIPIRGGTDGAQLTTKKGLPCPDLGEGALAVHGPYEHASQRNMDQTVKIILEIIRRYAIPGSAPKRIP